MGIIKTGRRDAFGAIAATAMLAPAAALGQIQFEDVSAASGIDYVGESWGSAWGDFNGDGRPDLWTSNHGPLASLWLNNGDGTFTNIATEVLPIEVQNGPIKDEHGSSWVDFDNDGDQDMLQIIAGGGQDQANRMYVNTGGVLVDQAAALKLDLPEGRGRTPLWFDYDDNGLLDVLISTATSGGQLLQAPSLNLQFPGGFVNVTAKMQLELEESSKMVLYSDVYDGPRRELLIGASSRSLRAYATPALPFTDISNVIGLGTPRGLVDGIAADLTGNLVPDIYIVEGEFGEDIVQTDSQTVEAHVSPFASEEGMLFETSGDVTFSLYPNFNVNVNDVYIGAAGMHPTSKSFTLSASDTDVQGRPDYVPGAEFGFFIYYDLPNQQWRITLSHFGLAERNIVVTSTAPINNVAPIGFALVPIQDADNFLVRDASGVYQQEGASRGVAGASFGRNIGVGDFDNDMDLDIYIVSTGPVENLPNTLYENDGTGHLTLVANAGGAAGGTLGRGDAVTVADYDEDGFLDLFVTNGKSKPPFEADGPYNLFRNAGNSNHWLQIDLEGVSSNRDAIGARIVATANGVDQLREYGNDMHFRAQNHRRAHFGLADQLQVDELTIEWPSGITQVIENLPADQRVRIVEPVSASVEGKPKYEAGVSDGAFLWYDTAAGLYRLRASGGNDVAFHFRLVAQQALGDVTPFKLGRNDRLTVNEFGFDLAVVVNNSENGVDFTLPVGSPVLLSVSRDGLANPRQLTVGAGNGRLPPAGWIASYSQLSALPAFTAGVDMGLHIGAGEASNSLQARWTGDASTHDARLVVIADQAIAQITPVSLEGNDTLLSGANFVNIDSTIGTGEDGVDMQLPGDALLGISYLHDGLFQQHRINSGQFPSLPDAYWLPALKPVTAGQSARKRPPQKGMGKIATRRAARADRTPAD